MSSKIKLTIQKIDTLKEKKETQLLLGLCNLNNLLINVMIQKIKIKMKSEKKKQREEINEKLLKTETKTIMFLSPRTKDNKYFYGLKLH